MDRVILLPIKMGNEFRHLFGSNIKYWDNTWVAFDYNGEVSAYISKRDYLDYKENLSCSQLCKSLGEVFIDFHENFTMCVLEFVPPFQFIEPIFFLK